VRFVVASFVVAREENVRAGRRFDAVVARAAEYHGDQPSNNVTASGRELCGGGSPQYVQIIDKILIL